MKEAKNPTEIFMVLDEYFDGDLQEPDLTLGIQALDIEVKDKKEYDRIFKYLSGIIQLFQRKIRYIR